MSEAHQGLAEQAIAALKWNYVGALVRAGSQILIGIVLARILGPEPFGLVAIAWLVISFGNLVADFGFGAALVQRKELSDIEVRYTFTIQVLIGLGLTVFIASSAGLVAQVFQQQETVAVVEALSLVFVIQSFGQTATSLLKRNLDFKSLQFAQVLSYLVSYLLLGIPLAYRGFGVWSLVIAQLSQTLLCVILTYIRVQHPVKPLFTSRAAGFFSFGTKVMVTNLVNWLIINLDNVFVGKFFGVVSLGLYNRTYMLMTTPMNNVVTMLQGVLFSAYSKVQEDTTRLKRVYLASASMISLIMLPVFGSVAVVPGTVIEGIYGNRWLDAVPLLVPLALAMPFHSVMALAGPLIWGRGKVELELRVQVITAALFIVVMLVTSKVSVVSLGWGVFGVYVVRFILMTTEVLQLLGACWLDVLRSFRGAVFIWLWIAGLIWGIDLALLFLKTPALLRLGLEMLAGGVGAVGLAVCLPKLVLAPELVWLLGRFSDKFPKAFRAFIAHTQLKA